MDQQNIEKDQNSTYKLYFDYKENLKCMCCKGKYHLQFHHYDPSDKFMAVGTMVRWGFEWQDIKDEISKCVPICEKCHNRIHQSNSGLHR